MAQHSHKRETAHRRPRAALIAGPLAVLATGAAIGLGVAGTEPARDLVTADSSAAADLVGDRERAFGSVSRGDGERRSAAGVKRSKSQPLAAVLSEVDQLLSDKAVATAVENADTHRWTSTALNLWTRPDGLAENVGEIPTGKKVLVTGRSAADRVEIVVAGKARWVTAGYLSDEKPVALGGECTNGTSVPSGVSPNIVKVHEAVCANFPEITVYGTFRSDGEHSQGLAIDIMVSGDRGWEVAEFVRDNYADLGVSYLIYAQQIWSVERSGEGWRGMEDRGSATANHYDHVHVTTY